MGSNILFTFLALLHLKMAKIITFLVSINCRKGFAAKKKKKVLMKLKLLTRGPICQKQCVTSFFFSCDKLTFMKGNSGEMNQVVFGR